MSRRHTASSSRGLAPQPLEQRPSRSRGGADSVGAGPSVRNRSA